MTSAVRSPALDGIIALGYVRRDLADAGGAAVEVSSGTRRVPAVLTSLPFVPPSGGTVG